MKIKITNCSYEGYWYIGLIGNIFEVRNENLSQYFVTVGIFGNYGIIKEDCAIVEPEKPVPEYKPYTWNDRIKLRNRWIKHKHSEYEMMCIEFSKKGIGNWENGFIDGFIDWKSMLENYTYTDGTPCGINQ